MAKKKRHVPRPQIPPGKYFLSYQKHWVYSYQNESLKLVILFVVLEGKYAGEKIARICNVDSAKGKRPFRVRKSQNFWAEFCAVMEGHLDTKSIRLDEVPVAQFAGLRIRGRVRYVLRNREGVKLVDGASYSVVGNLLESEPVGKSKSETDSKKLSHAKPTPPLKPTLTPIPTPRKMLANHCCTDDTGDNVGKNAQHPIEDHWTPELLEFRQQLIDK